MLPSKLLLPCVMQASLVNRLAPQNLPTFSLLHAQGLSLQLRWSQTHGGASREPRKRVTVHARMWHIPAQHVLELTASAENTIALLITSNGQTNGVCGQPLVSAQVGGTSGRGRRLQFGIS